MKTALVITFLLFPFCHLLAGDSISTFVLDKELRGRYRLADAVEWLSDPRGEFTIEEILNDTTLQSRFSRSLNLDSVSQNGRYSLWSRIKLINQSSKIHHFHIQLGYADTIDSYEVQGLSIRHWQTGQLINLHDRSYRSNRCKLPVTLSPGQSKILYSRHRSDDFMGPKFISSFKLASEVLERKVRYFSLFVNGILMIMIVLGILLFLVFRDRHYLLCTVPLIGFVLWFSDQHGELHFFLNSPPFLVKYFNPIFSSWFMPLTIAVYYSSYVRLKKALPWVYYFYWLAFGLIIILAIIEAVNNKWIPGISNITVLLITGVTVFSAVYLSLKGVKRARIWLIFTLPLILTGIIYLIGPFVNLPIYLEVSSLMQFGALLSGMILGYLMYDRVNSTIRENFRVVKANEHLVQEQNIILEQKVEKRTRELEAEKQKSESILLNILPEEVAEELKATGGSQAKHFENVTVLFTDFIDFTKAGEQMTPLELVSELHSCFKAFDEIIQKNGLEKIKTVGDAYIAVAGLPVPREDHAARVANAALEIRDFMKQRKQNLQVKTFSIRIGIHSGPVVAGIVGVKKFAYDIWGDTVNTAARMEQCSESGKINISRTTYELIKSHFQCISRGKLAAKNKGKMEMYFVKNIKLTKSTTTKSSA